MSDYKKSIKIDSDLCKVLSSIPEKFVVDFANGIDVARDHLRKQDNRNSFYLRCFDGFTGSGTRRQSEVNKSLTDAAEGSLNLLIDLSNSLASSNLAISRVNDRVTEINNNVALLIEYSVETRNNLKELELKNNARINLLSEEVTRIDYTQKASLNIDQVFGKWTAGRLDQLSLAGRCYAAMEELRWGAFGDFYRLNQGLESDKFLENIVDRATIQIASDVGATGTLARLRVYEDLLSHRPELNNDWTDALAYLADGFDAEKAPMIVTINQKLPERLSEVPLLATPSRIAEAIFSEVFQEVSYV